MVSGIHFEEIIHHQRKQKLFVFMNGVELSEGVKESLRTEPSLVPVAKFDILRRPQLQQDHPKTEQIVSLEINRGISLDKDPLIELGGNINQLFSGNVIELLLLVRGREVVNDEKLLSNSYQLGPDVSVGLARLVNVVQSLEDVESELKESLAGEVPSINQRLLVYLRERSLGEFIVGPNQIGSGTQIGDLLIGTMDHSQNGGMVDLDPNLKLLEGFLGLLFRVHEEFLEEVPLSSRGVFEDLDFLDDGMVEGLFRFQLLGLETLGLGVVESHYN